TREIRWQAGLIELMQAYARLRTRDEFRPYAYDRRDIWSLDDALERMRRLIGHAGDWTDLMRFLPDGWTATPARRRSATAATFAASLELARQGRVELRQEAVFAPISVRPR
ncbi:MAG TPA: segregation/condensation protein A, partial [Paracoccus sp.]|nr:segregation/condensation protein A [Paracoccus sp. (in: a-proteobacteria)]